MAKSQEENNGREPLPHEVKMVIFGIIALICLVIFLIFLFGSWYTIDAGERGIILTFGNPSKEISQPGFHFKLPIIQKLLKYSIRTQTIAFDNKQGDGDKSEYSSLFAASSDLQETQTAVVCNFHINEQDVITIYRQYGDSHTYNINIIEPIIRDTVKSISALYTAEELVTKRPEVAKAAADLLRERLAAKNAILDNLNIVNFEFSPEYTKAIEAKAVQAQTLEKSRIELETIKVQAASRIAQAEGEAKAIQIQVAAINQQGGANYVSLQAIQRWNGQLPYVSGGGSMPFIDMRTLGGAATAFVSNSTA
jgi:regulator of protease activity HflC (stomatin/prohibitin superfamily)